MIRGDRIFGAVMIVLALGYILGAMNIQTSFVSDPVGPSSFPLVIAGVVILCSVTMILRPDPDAEWPAGPMLLQLGLAVAVLLAYAYMIDPLGFILPTSIVAGILSWQISRLPVKSAIAGVGLGVGLFVLFKTVLGLGLRGFPQGWGI